MLIPDFSSLPSFRLFGHFGRMVCAGHGGPFQTEGRITGSRQLCHNPEPDAGAVITVLAAASSINSYLPDYEFASLRASSHAALSSFRTRPMPETISPQADPVPCDIAPYIRSGGCGVCAASAEPSTFGLWRLSRPLANWSLQNRFGVRF